MYSHTISMIGKVRPLNRLCRGLPFKWKDMDAPFTIPLLLFEKRLGAMSINKMRIENLSLLPPFQTMISSTIFCVQALGTNFRECRCSEDAATGSQHETKNAHNGRQPMLNLTFRWPCVIV